MLLRRGMVIATALLLAFASVLFVSGASAAAAAPADVFIGDVTDSPDPVDLQATVFYFIPVGNDGPGTATEISVTAQLPPGASFQPQGSTSSCITALTTVTCSVSSLPAGSGGVLIIGVTPTTETMLSLTFVASGAQPDHDLSNNSQTEITTVTAHADVALDLDVSADVVHAGERWFLEARVSNAGPSPATGVTATLRLPAALAVASGATCRPDGAEQTCTIGPIDLPAPGGVIALLDVTANSAGTYSIEASVTADTPDPQPANNSDLVTVTVIAAADVAVTLEESADPTGPGKALIYTLRVINHGPSPASEVSLTAEWAATTSGGIVFLSLEASQGDCVSTAPSALRCSLGNLADGATSTITLRLRPQGVGSITIRVGAMAAEDDPVPVNNVATEATTVG
jgi:uncharacterized repeat protein (TIGR01451 family)